MNKVICKKTMFKIRIKYFLAIIFILLGINISFAEQRSLPWVDIVTRSQWWADESIRLKSNPVFQQQEKDYLVWLEKLEQMKADNTDEYKKYVKDQYESETANNYMKENYWNEISVDTVNRYLDWVETTWNKLSWAEAFKDQKVKFIIHHTADELDEDVIWWKDAEITEMKRIYRFHALSRWRGDIGYNFVIWPSGKIYEWRAGGVWVVGAHTKWNNVPSVWISLMWNFNKTKPTQKQIDSLVKLLTQLAKKYNVNPFAKANYHKEINQFPYLKSTENYTIVWHKDAGSTSCPWAYLYAKLPDIRQKVKTELSKIQFINSEVAFVKVPWIQYLDQNNATLTIGDLPLNNVTSCYTKDTKLRISSCIYQNGNLNIQIVKWTWFTSWVKEFQVLDGKWNKKTLSVLILWQTDLDPILQNLKKKYRSWIWNTGFFNKIFDKIDINQVKNLLSQKVRVLLYEASNLSWYSISCPNKCSFSLNNTTLSSGSWTLLKSANGFYLSINWQKIESDSINVSWNWWVVQIVNYNRKSYWWVSWNTFKWNLVFQKDLVIENAKEITKLVVINILDFEDYMRWIVETNDTETLEKNKVMALIAKNYMLFYMNKKNNHPSLPSNAGYNAIDNPNIFQKYVWAWLEKTLKLRYQALELTKNQVILYGWYLPILPYFNCSAWFTRTAKEKFGWQDTPYLVSRADVSKCTSFNWHGVGLSGKGAQRRSKIWRKYNQIIKYYYQGVEVADF